MRRRGQSSEVSEWIERSSQSRAGAGSKGKLSWWKVGKGGRDGEKEERRGETVRVRKRVSVGGTNLLFPLFFGGGVYCPLVTMERANEWLIRDIEIWGGRD